MDPQERTYSPGKPSDVYQRGFPNVMGGSIDPQQTHATIALQVAGYPLGVVATGAASSRQPFPSYSTALHAPVSVGAYHVQAAVSAGTVHAPTAVGPAHVQTHALTLPAQPPVMGLHAPAHSLPPHAPALPPVLTSQAQVAQMCSWMPGVSSASFSSEPSANQASQQQQQQQQQFQRLKVEDALSYLDQVKLQFCGQPQVYNDFLDIMKEFKSQSIDTPGVIRRVSCLFRGHPDLIVGFNTFLPPGYKIAVDNNETISVQQPGQQALSLPIFQATHSVQPPIKPMQLSSPDVHSIRPDALLPSQPVPPAAQPTSTAGTSTGQPVEFNHAIQYVNKIKLSYQSQPEVYRSFLDILHKYQKEQKMLKEGAPFPPEYKPLTELEVYTQVRELFRDQPQLLDEFSQFLPDANGSSALMGGCGATESALARMRSDLPASSARPALPAAGRNVRAPTRANTGSTRSSYQPPVKKTKLSCTGSELDNPATPAELSFFDKVRHELGGHDYANFIRCIDLYTKQIASAPELLLLIDPFISKVPELRPRILEYLKQRDDTISLESLAVLKDDQPSKAEWRSSYIVDLSTCKEEGVSYRILPKSIVPAVCSGRSKMHNDVLNDTYALHASWPEDLSSLSAYKKNQYEEHMYQCEDERYELDMVLELNTMAKTALMNVMAKLKKLTCPDDVARFRLDDSLGANSEKLMRVALTRLYGDKTSDVIEGLKCSPAAAVPVVLRRLSAKEKEWRTAQHAFNRLWREQNERYHLKSLDHQAAKFKQNDVKHIRSKSLLKEIETIVEERRKVGCDIDHVDGAHMTLTCPDSSILVDAASIVMHYFRRQTGLQPEDKARIRRVLYHLAPSLFSQSMPMSSDNDGDTDDDVGLNSDVKNEPDAESKQPLTNGSESKPKPSAGMFGTEQVKKECDDTVAVSDRTISIFYGNDNWYYFLRLYILLCERLKSFRLVAVELADEEARFRPLRSTSVTEALKLRNPNAVEVSESYSYLLDMVRGLLDNNMELGAFEDQLREVFGIHAYVAFTIDKLIQNIGRQLQHITSKDLCWKLAGLFESTIKSSISTELDYQHEAEQIIGEENCFKIVTDASKMELSIELMEAVSSSSSSIGDQSMVDNASIDDVTSDLQKKSNFLARNLRKVFSAKKFEAKPTDEDVMPTNVQVLDFNEATKEFLFYTCGSFGLAKKNHGAVSRYMEKKFRHWLNKWQHTHVTEAMIEGFSSWLLGHTDGLKAGLETVSQQIVATDQPPYRTYVKYNVVIHTPVQVHE